MPQNNGKGELNIAFRHVVQHKCMHAPAAAAVGLAVGHYCSATWDRPVVLLVVHSCFR
jgi:hypothetical protein